MYHKLCGLKQQKCVLSWSWRLEVRNQGVSRATFPLKPPGEDPSLPLPASEDSWLVFLGLRQHNYNLCLHLHTAVFLLRLCVSVSSRGVLRVCLCLCPNFPLLQGSRSYRIKAHLGDRILTHLNLQRHTSEAELSHTNSPDCSTVSLALATLHLQRAPCEF